MCFCSPHNLLPPPLPSPHVSVSQLINLAHVRTERARPPSSASNNNMTACSTLHPDTASSDLYERFEALSADAAACAWRPSDLRLPRDSYPMATFSTPPPDKSLEVTAQFDARQQVGDQRGRAGKAVFPSKVLKVGPLRQGRGPNT